MYASNTARVLSSADKLNSNTPLMGIDDAPRGVGNRGLGHDQWQENRRSLARGRSGS